MIMLSTVVVYAGGYLFLVFFAVCLATGLYYVAELVEEYTKLTRRIVSYAIKGVIGLHVLLLLWDRLPILCIGIGIGAHIMYHRLLKAFPFISLTSTDFLASVGLLVASHIVWFRYFLYDQRNLYLTLEYVIGFFLIMVWLVPFVYFISLAANESVLPGAPGAAVPSFIRSDSDVSDIRTARKSRGSLLGLLNFLRKKRDEVLPMVAARIPASYLGKNERQL